MRTIFLGIFAAFLATAQTDLRNTITFSGGYARDVNAYCCQTDTATSLGFTYGYRLYRFLQVEAGVTTALHPAPEIRGANYDIKPNDRFIWVPFGVRGILPLREGRIELSAGGGGLYDKYSVSNPNPTLGLAPHSGWGGYFAGGGAIAIDKGRHFWLGASPKFFLANTSSAVNSGFSHDRWFVISGDLSFRF